MKTKPTKLTPGLRVRVKGYRRIGKLVRMGPLQAHVKQPIWAGVLDLYVPVSHVRAVRPKK